MNISQDEFRGRIYEVIKDKVFISNISGQMVDVVEKLPGHIVDEEVLFDGFTLYDGIEGGGGQCTAYYILHQGQSDGQRGGLLHGERGLRR